MISRIAVRRFPTALVAVALLAAACSQSDQPSSSSSTTSPEAAVCQADGSSDAYRTDLMATGNRVIKGRGSLLSTEPVVVALPGVAEWVVPYAVNESGVTWFVSLRSGDSLLVDPSGEIDSSDVQLNGAPPEIRLDSAGSQVVSAYGEQSLFENKLADSRVVTDGDIAVALVDLSDQYDHAILGDRFEAKAFEVFNRCTGERTKTTVESQDVIEGISAMLADIDGDGALDVLVTISNAEDGSRLAAYKLDGTLIAESEPIGQGGRWRNQLAVAPVGPNGEVEIVDVRKPHATGEVEYLRLLEGSLVVVADEPGFTNHVIRTQNLDRGIIADADGDGQLDVIVLTRSLTEIAVITRVEGGVETRMLTTLDAEVSSNISAAELPTGTVSFAVGTEDGQIRVWN